MRWIFVLVAAVLAMPSTALAGRWHSHPPLHLIDGELTLGGASLDLPDLAVQDDASLSPTDVLGKLTLGARHSNGISPEVKPVLALVLGLVVGFGTGHLVAGDTQGFILFLIIDAAILVSSALLAGTAHVWWAVGGVALLVSHIVQGILAYQEAGGPRIVEWTRKNAIEIADAGRGESQPVTRAFALAF